MKAKTIFIPEVTAGDGVIIRRIHNVPDEADNEISLHPAILWQGYHLMRFECLEVMRHKGLEQRQIDEINEMLSSKDADDINLAIDIVARYHEDLAFMLGKWHNRDPNAALAQMMNYFSQKLGKL